MNVRQTEGSWGQPSWNSVSTCSNEAFIFCCFFFFSPFFVMHKKKKLYILSIRTGFTAIKYIFTAIITILKSHIPINFLMQTFLTPVLHLSKYILTLVSTYHQVVNTKWKCTAYTHRDRSWSHVLRIEKTLMRKLDKIELVPN